MLYIKKCYKYFLALKQDVSKTRLCTEVRSIAFLKISNLFMFVKPYMV